MTVKALVELVNNSKNKLLKPEQLQAILKKELEIKDYLSIKDKKQLVEDIVNTCILLENGVFKFDEIEKYIVFTMKTIEAYTNIELSVDIEDDYDALCESKLMDVVIALIGKEYNDVSILLQMKCDYVLNENHIEAQVGRFLNGISESLDGFLNVCETNLNLQKLFDNAPELNKILDLIKK